MSHSDYTLLEPHLRRQELTVGDPLFNAGEPIESVYFLESGVGSIVAEQEGGEKVEVGLYGSEGMSGCTIVLGVPESPHSSMLQVGNGAALKIASGHLEAACGRSPTLLRLLLRYVHAMNVQAAMTAASNAHYALPERLARWLLMCHDRLDGDRIELTDDFISMMLGVRRSGVTVTLHTLEATGSLRATRGVVTITDRGRLEEIAGDGYGRAEAEYRRLIAPFGKGRHGMAAIA
jgi:CRP-like cAMP-binding protein